MTNDRSDFTQGNILKKLVSFMMPILGALILQAAYGAVDLLVVEGLALLPDFLQFLQAARS